RDESYERRLDTSGFAWRRHHERREAMKGWLILVTGPDTEIGENLRRRIVAVATVDSDEAFAVARAKVPGGMPTSVGLVADDVVTDLRLKAGEGRVLGAF